jgi:hypothetical protein
MDSGDNWNGGFDYFTVDAQEIGHALGLGHSQDLGGTNIMNGIYNGAIDTYSANDIEHILAVYGDSGVTANDAPVVSITSPGDDATFGDPLVPISFTGTASDTDDGVSPTTWFGLPIATERLAVAVASPRCSATVITPSLPA